MKVTESQRTSGAAQELPTEQKGRQKRGRESKTFREAIFYFLLL